MSTAELILEYIKALTWPGVATGAVYTFRRPLADKIKGLKTLDAAGVKTTFETEAEALETRADQAATLIESDPETLTRQQPQLDVPADKRDPAQAPTPSEAEANRSQSVRAVQVALARQALETLERSPDFDVARRVAVADPNAAVMAAYRQVEQGLSAVQTLLGTPNPKNRVQVPASVVRELRLDEELNDVFAELRRLRNTVTHSVEDVGIGGALAYIAAAERLMGTVVNIVASRLRHPSRYLETAEMLGLGEDQPDGQ